MKYQAQAPLVVDLAGVPTDLPEFADSDSAGGAVLAVALATYASGWIVRTNGTHQGAWHAMVGGAHSEVNYEVDAPLAVGLATSTAQTLVWLTLVKSTVANVDSRQELAGRAWRTEMELGTGRARWAAYAAAIGGITFTRFAAEVDVEEVRPGFPFTDEFQRRLVVAYPENPPGRNTSEGMAERFHAPEQAIGDVLPQLRGLAYRMKEALVGHDLEAMGSLMNEHWTLQRRAYGVEESQASDELVSVVRSAGAIGAKGLGTGGLGSIVALTGEGQERSVAEALKRAGARQVPIAFDWYGVYLRKS